MSDTENASFSEHHLPTHNFKALVIAAIGVVFGDIGTSPLYALKTIIDLSGGHLVPEELIGCLSLIFWTLIVIPTVKYLTFVMRVDNHGEGGIVALMSLLSLSQEKKRPMIIALGLFGAALVFGDGSITPAISVLSAIEGLKIAAPGLTPFILPIAVVVIIALFSVQFQGTARIGWIFGPVTVVWFLTIGGLGLWGIIQHPEVLAALNPYHAAYYLLTHGNTGFFVLGGVFLVVTGSEALYADMGHIGAKAIRVAWYGLVLPSLMLNYAGQTGMVLAGGSMEDNIFYRLCPSSMLLPLIILATCATVIASQAMITGAFSITRQIIQLGWCPRLKITQTSAEGFGQIYIGAVNWMIMITTLVLCISFGSSDRLASAYGIAVAGTMILTSSLMFVAMREIWQWPLWLCVVVAGIFFTIDLTFVSANLIKFFEGGWVPVVIAAIVFSLMYIWHRGREVVVEALSEGKVSFKEFNEFLESHKVARVHGTAIFLTKVVDATPPLMVWHVVHNRVLHKQAVALAVVTEQIPWVRPSARMTVEQVMPDMWQIVARYGFMERPNIPSLLRQLRRSQTAIQLDDVTYYIGRDTIIPRPYIDKMPFWQEQIYAFMQRNSAEISDYFRLPRDNVVELGRQIEI